MKSHEEMAKNLGELIEWLDETFEDLKKDHEKELRYQASLVEREVKSA